MRDTFAPNKVVEKLNKITTALPKIKDFILKSTNSERKPVLKSALAWDYLV